MRTLSEISETVLTNAQNQTTNSLTEAESLELIGLEATVERGLRAFWEIGQALCKIRDRHLYRENYSTFEEYCLNRWEMCRRSADRLIAAASVYEKFETHGSQILPANERQVRPLTALPPEQQLEAWTQVVSTAPKGKITSTHVAQVVKEYKLAINSDHNSSNKNSLSQSNKQHTFERQNQRSCWNCYHCSAELIKDQPDSFYCYQFGKLNFIEKDANQRGTECELWAYRCGESAKEKTINQPKKETFTLTLQLPAHWQPLMKDAAKTEELVLVDWAIKVLEKALNSFELNSDQILTTKDFFDGSTKLPERDAVIPEIISEKTAA
jgi:hypothetical protein